MNMLMLQDSGNRLHNPPRIYDIANKWLRLQEKGSLSRQRKASSVHKMAQWLKVLAEPSLMSWLQPQGPTWWKGRINSFKLSSDLHMCENTQYKMKMLCGRMLVCVSPSRSCVQSRPKRKAYSIHKLCNKTYFFSLQR